MTTETRQDPTGQPAHGGPEARAAEAAEALGSSFISVISHELQTPLAIIKGYASTLARTDAAWSPDQIREGLAVIEEEADRLNRLVEDLLAVSRIQALGLSADRAPVDLPSLVSWLLRRFETAHREHRFVVDSPADIPMVLADHQKVEMVLRNLLDNAAKYAPSGSTIAIRLRFEPKHQSVRISIEDEGPGIPTEARERVFERFYRVDGSDTREHRGAGLGLFLCRAIVEAHGGHIWVEPREGRGTVVTFTLPIE
jgi:signal transduction histidine kinase